MAFSRGLVLAVIAYLCSFTVLAAPTCTSDKRLFGAKQVVYSYNLVGPGETAKAAKLVPFGPDCYITITPNGLVPVPTAFNGDTCYDFLVETRQVFSKVTGTYEDFTNGTAVIRTNVTLGAAHTVTIPVTFSGDVFLDYDMSSCLIKAVRAFAKIPSQVFGTPVDTPNFGISR